MDEKELSPCFQFFVKDYLSSGRVELMSLAQEGAYIRLLCRQWLDGSIPADIPSLARLCRVQDREMAKLWPGIAPCFNLQPSPGRLQNGRLEEERRKQAQNRAIRSEGGRKGARTRWANGSAMGYPCSSDSSPMPEPSSGDSSGDSSAMVEPMAQNSLAVCSLQIADCNGGATHPKAGACESWLSQARDRILAVYPAEHTGGEVDAERVIFEMARLGTLVPDGEPVRHRHGVTVASFCRAVEAWKRSDAWQRGKVHSLRNFAEKGVYLTPAPVPKPADERRAAGAHDDPQPSRVRRLA